MKSTSHRIAPGSGHTFAGHRINRSLPITFRLDGHKFEGFVGDTVLSALLANGVRIAGQHMGAPVALTPHFAPHIALAREAENPAYALPMTDVIAADGAEYVTLNGAVTNPLARIRQKLTSKGRIELGGRFDDPFRIPEPLHAHDKVPAQTFDLVVVGGGIAGMSAALHAADMGEHVALVERRDYLGGDAVLFGHLEGELAPDAQIASMIIALNDAENIQVFCGTRVRALSDDTLTTQRLMQTERGPQLKESMFSADRFILATGCSDGLPLFAGNRLPGVFGMADAFHMAWAYGVWPFAETIIAGGSNAMYRFGRLAQDAGCKIKRILDVRMEPKSRFLDFAKAYGIHLVSGSQIGSVSRTGGTPDLTIQPRLSWSEYASARQEALVGDGLIVCAGWTPRLDLWCSMGGSITWQDGGFQTQGRADNISLAGSAAGYKSQSACIQSGIEACNGLYDCAQNIIEEKQVSELFETADSIMEPISPDASDLAPAYLSEETSLAAAGTLGEASKRAWHWRPRHKISNPETGTRWLSTGDVQSLVRQNVLPMSRATITLDERNLSPDIIEALPVPAIAEHKPDTFAKPDFLAGRFGKNSLLCTFRADDERQFDVGSLVYANTDMHDPLHAVGAVIAVANNIQTALVDAQYAVKGERLAIRMANGNIAITIAEARA